MRAPRCDKCGTDHWSTQECPADRVRTGPLTTVDVKVMGAQMRAAQTSAERSKRWRVTGDVEGKRKRNAERMRRKRDG